MKNFFTLICSVLLINTTAFAFHLNNDGGDTSEVIKLNKRGFLIRLTDPEEAVADGAKALEISKRINYTQGIGESYRIMGIGNYYLDKSKEAIDNYLTALNYFQQINDLQSEAKVYNNIGNLYSHTDDDQALEFFQKSLTIAEKFSDKHLIATLNMNMGTVFYHKKSFSQALNMYNVATEMFITLKDSMLLIQCMQNKGVVYFNLKQYDKARALLLEANKEARQLDLNETVAALDLTLADLYINLGKYDEAEKTIAEGINLAGIVKSEKMQSDFKHTSYELAKKRKNYSLALTYLYDIYHQDSVMHEHGASTQFNLIREQLKTQARQKENEILLQRQAYDRVKFFAVMIVSVLLLICTLLLINNVKRKTKTNDQLKSLNEEVSRQKDNLDRINHHLEEIIDDRTKDLQVKNKKLSEYSSYLSHQIRGPISTLKGLMNLEKEGLVDQQECINMMNKCVSEIDDKIMEISDMLHDTRKTR
jgi:tetratricopeptide (TPR) repeat protein